MIEELPWDSDFFGFKIGKIIVDKLFDINQIKQNDFELIYVFSQSKLINISPIDRKVNFEKKIKSKIDVDKSIINYSEEVHNYSELLELVYLSGKFSRFKIDKGFLEQDFNRLYKKWLDESIKKNNAFSLLIKSINHKIVGFVTVEKKNNIISRIGLIAVSSDFQGGGIASQLIEAAEIESFKQGYTKLQVATQLDNKPAMQLYKKNGFDIESVTNIYHIWKR